MSLAVTPRTDREVEVLVALAREGDPRAFEGLYRRLGGLVYGVCLRMAGDPGRAEELAQEAWVKAWERLESFRGESRFSTWLHRLTVNVILDGRRRDDRWRKRFESLDAGCPENASPTPAPPPGLQMDLERAVAGLPEGARAVFVLYDVEGYPQKEIAERLGVTEGTVKSQLHRARKLLREVMER